MNITIEKDVQKVPQKRIDYIDAMKGFTMILVVYCHICNFSLHYTSLIDSIFIRFRMPLFFFISGLMVYSSKPFMSWIRRKFKSRLVNMLLPTIVTCFLFTSFISHSFEYAIFDTNKLGYWFTFVLFEMFLVYIAIEAITNRLPRVARLVTYLLVIIVSCLLFIYMHQKNLLESDICNLFCIPRFLFNLSYFCLGIICKMYVETFLKVIQNKYFTLLILVFFIISVSFDLHNIALKYLTRIFGVFIVYRTFQYNKDFFASQNKVSKGLSFIGKNTLPIYFLHYFIIQGISIDNKYIIYAISNSWLFELFFCFILSLFVVVLCLITNHFLKSFKIVHALMFGPEIKM